MNSTSKLILAFIIFSIIVFGILMIIVYPSDDQESKSTDPRAYIITGQLAVLHAESYRETHDETGGLIETVNLTGSLGAVKIIPEDKLRNGS